MDVVLSVIVLQEGEATNNVGKVINTICAESQGRLRGGKGHLQMACISLEA